MNKITGLAAALSVFLAGHAGATTIYSSTKVAGPQQSINFNLPESILNAGNIFSANSPSVSFVADQQLTIGQDTAPLGINGTWGAGAAFLAFDFVGMTNLTISFNGKTTRSFGADWSLFESNGDSRALSVKAFDKNGFLLESFSTARDGIDDEDNLLNSSVNSSFFQGIRRKDADIAFITISGDRIVMDNFTYTMPVPEPEAFAMLLAGVGLIGGIARRRIRR